MNMQMFVIYGTVLVFNVFVHVHVIVRIAEVRLCPVVCIKQCLLNYIKT